MVIFMHSIQCNCGAVKGKLENIGTSNRLICYCTDCRAFAHFLDKAPAILDAQGGTEIVQVAQQHLLFSQGEEFLSAVRLSEKGMIRWYASCCGTPIGNTLASPKMSFIGLIHNCLDRQQMDKDFGAKVAVLNTDTALGHVKPKQSGLFGFLFRFLWIVTTNRINGGYKKSALFNATGLPRVTPETLRADELDKLKN
ncbi:DUF6151 family protein [Rheinheimera baltica]|uniref:DUF6151 family protein n=2 Tax=Rheinheimera baltica TaxID=67576 RepID=A0ABT9I412_9GAMM|nr:DUF6151 family protein [Rheinheimera baltica]MDP5138128.1 DUF6151 family protein [Rheinheimera baltica]